MSTLVTTIKVDIDADKITSNLGLEEHGRAQTALDLAVVRMAQPYIPMDTGVLAGAFTQTDFGSGLIVQSTPYARYLYYGELYVDPITKKGAFHDEKTDRFWSRAGVQKIPSGRKLKYSTTRHAQAGAFWFDRMKADHMEDLKQVVVREMNNR